MSRRLYIGNLAYEVTEQDLRHVFAEGGGTIADIKVILDRETGRSRGFGFVEMSSDAEAAQAVETLNGREVQGRAISISEARERTGGGSGGGGGGGHGGGGRAGGGRSHGGGAGGGGAGGGRSHGGGAGGGGAGGGGDRSRRGAW